MAPLRALLSSVSDPWPWRNCGLELLVGWTCYGNHKYLVLKTKKGWRQPDAWHLSSWGGCHLPGGHRKADSLINSQLQNILKKQQLCAACSALGTGAALCPSRLLHGCCGAFGTQQNSVTQKERFEWPRLPPPNLSQTLFPETSLTISLEIKALLVLFLSFFKETHLAAMTSVPAVYNERGDRSP